MSVGLWIVALLGCSERPSAENVPAEAANEEPAVETTPEAPMEKMQPADGEQSKWSKLPEGHHPALLDPTLATATAPDRYRVRFDTTKGVFEVSVERAWAPLGADRFYNLVSAGFFDGVAFFRVIDKFMAQFGVSGYPAVSAAWKEATIADEPVEQSNTRGRLTFAKSSAPNSRTTQVFINTVDNQRLDEFGFAPIGEVVVGMDVVDALYNGYGEGAPRGLGPSQMTLGEQGNTYLEAEFDKLDTVRSATIVVD